MSLRMFEQSEKIADELRQQGIRVASKPLVDSIPRLPKDITSLSDEDLMDLFVNVTSWVDYMSVQVAAAQIDERAAQRALDYAEAQAMVDGWGGGRDSRVAVAKAKRSLDPKVIQLHDELEERYAYRKYAETITSNLDRDAALISRELTRRTAPPTAPRRAGSYL